MSYVEIILNVPLNGSFTYSTEDPSVQVGIRAEVFFGRRKMTGFVVSVSEEYDEKKNAGLSKDKIKPVIRFIDKTPLFSKEQTELADWISKYYLCYEGEALSAMLPSGRRASDKGSFGFNEDKNSYEKKTLSEEQSAAVEGILSGGTLHYLYGQTGSGKTEVFLGAAEKILQTGKGVIYLVPEIGLTHQVIEAVTKRFGKNVAVLHSGLTGSQRLKEWHRILNREARIVIGARSAIFAPVPDLGLIIIDEEHDSSYKSGNTPRYHARQVAMYLSFTKKIPLVMGSATPSVEAWQLINENKIVCHKLTKRLAGGKEPEIQVIDLSNPEISTKMNGCISLPLAEEIRRTKNEGRQTILFLNRRGFSHFFRCNTCGYELKCKNCSVPLTFHKNEKRLRCHYCGWSVSMPSSCPECNSLDVGYSGFGTEFIEEEVKSKFPDCSVERIDTDTLSNKTELEEKLQAFRDGKVDILLGTQMVAKGLNFPNLKLVGVILADTGLHLPDFRASERTFSLIVQVSGRAGRFFPDGKVLVQSYNPNHPAISLACSSDIEGFYSQELDIRQMTGFPPFSRLLRLVFRAPTETKAREASESAFGILKSISEKLKINAVEMLGPTECPLSMIAANYRMQILLRSEKITNLQQIVNAFVKNYKTPSGVYTEIDVDPVNLL